MISQSINIDQKKRNLGQIEYLDGNRSFENIYSANQQLFTSTSYETVNESSFTRFFESQTLVLILATFQMFITGSGPGAAEIAIDVDGSNVKSLTSLFGQPKTSTLYHSILLDSGEHELKLKARLTDDFGFQEVRVQETRFAYIELIKK